MRDAAPSCTTLLPLYRAWGGLIQALKDVLLEIEREDRRESRQKFLDIQIAIDEAREAFRNAFYKQEIMNGQPVVAVEKLAGELIGRLFLPIEFKVDFSGAHVSRLKVVVQEAKRIEQLFSLMILFPEMRELDVAHCKSFSTIKTPLPQKLERLIACETNLRECPELPSSLKNFDIRSTPLEQQFEEDAAFREHLRNKYPKTWFRIGW